jgi:hypothetical protein
MIAMKIEVDAYAWMEVFLGSEVGRRPKRIIEAADCVLTPGRVLLDSLSTANTSRFICMFTSM